MEKPLIKLPKKRKTAPETNRLHSIIENYSRKEKNEESESDSSELDSEGSGGGVIEKIEKVVEEVENKEENMKECEIEKDSSVFLKYYRRLGIVCGELPMYYHRNSREDLITLVVDSGFQTYKVEKLQLLYISTQISRKIGDIVVEGDYFFTAVRRDIVVWHRIHRVALMSGHSANITKLLICGESLILSVDKGGALFIWERESYTKLGVIQLPGYSRILMHPRTYLNKVLVGGKDWVELWNIRTYKKIYAFRKIIDNLRGDILCITESPCVDLVGIGTSEGDIRVVNIRKDSVILTFTTQTPVLSLAFSSSPLFSTSLLASALANGHILFWDLNSRTLFHTFTSPHRSHPSSSILFIPNSPIFISSSASDNSLKSWDLTHSPRPLLLVSREGADQGGVAKFYDPQGMHLITAGGTHGQGLIRDNSVRSEHISRTFTLKGNGNPVPIINLDFSYLRGADWDNIISCHDGLKLPLLWSYHRKTIGSTSLQQPVAAMADIITQVAATKCGNFAILGHTSGNIQKYSMQSGLYRGQFSNL